MFRRSETHAPGQIIHFTREGCCFHKGLWGQNCTATVSTSGKLAPAESRLAGGPILKLSGLESGRNSARKTDLRNINYPYTHSNPVSLVPSAPYSRSSPRSGCIGRSLKTLRARWPQIGVYPLLGNLRAGLGRWGGCEILLPQNITHRIQGPDIRRRSVEIVSNCCRI